MILTSSLGDITFILALMALAITLLVYVMLRQRVSRVESADRELDAHALVQEFSQRLRRLEERLVDQKVGLEILELRQQKQNEAVSSKKVMLTSETLPLLTTKSVSPSLFGGEGSESSERKDLVFQRPVKEEKRSSDSTVLVRSEMEALKFVLEADMKGATARDIQGRIARSREHTARMMNALFKEGLVERNSETRPFSYKITEKGRRVIKE